MYTLTKLFNHVGLRTNQSETNLMACLPGKIHTRLSYESTPRMKHGFKTQEEWDQRRVQCGTRSKDLSAASLGVQLASKHGIYQSRVINKIWWLVDLLEPIFVSQILLDTFIARYLTVLEILQPSGIYAPSFHRPSPKWFCEPAGRRYVLKVWTLLYANEPICSWSRVKQFVHLGHSTQHSRGAAKNQVTPDCLNANTEQLDWSNSLSSEYLVQSQMYRLHTILKSSHLPPTILLLEIMVMLLFIIYQSSS